MQWTDTCIFNFQQSFPLLGIEDKVVMAHFYNQDCMHSHCIVSCIGGNYAAKKGPIFNGQYIMGEIAQNTRILHPTQVLCALELVIELEGFETLRAIALLEHYGFKAALRVCYNFLQEIIRKVRSNKHSYFYLQNRPAIICHFCLS